MYHLYIVLTRTNTVMSKLIQRIKSDRYTHAAIALDKELNHMYGFGRRNTYNPWIGGFRKEDINEGVYRRCPHLPGAIIEVEVTKEAYETAMILLNHFEMNAQHYKYNYLGLLHNLMNKEIVHDDRFLCSEFVYYLIKEIGVGELNRPRNLVRPMDLLNLGGRIIYEGNLKEFGLEHLSVEKIPITKLAMRYE